MIKCTYKTDKRAFNVSFDYSAAIVEKIKSIPGRKYIPGNKSWDLPISPETNTFFQQNEIEYSELAINKITEISELNNHFNSTQNTLKSIRENENNIPDELILNTKLPQFSHQKVMSASSKLSGRMAYLVEMGAGKTKAALENIFDWSKGKNNFTAIICGPPESLYEWEKQAIKYIPKMKYIVIPSGLTPKKRNNLIDEALKLNSKIVLINYNSVGVAIDKLIELKPDCIVCDESHLLKNPASKRSIAVQELSDNCKYRLILTGTAILNSPSDIYGQYLILDGGATFGNSEIAFRERYFYDANEELRAKANAKVTWPDWQLKNGALEELKSKISRISVQYKKSECMTLPPKIYQSVYVDLSPEQREVYNSLVKKDMAEIGDETLLTSNILQRICKLRQVTSGFTNIPNVSAGGIIEHEFENQPKIEALKSIYEGLRPDQKIIIWTCYRRDCQKIYDEFVKMGENPVKYMGEMKTEDKNKSVDEFQNNPDCRIFVATVQVAGRSISLTAASYAVYYSNDYSLEHRLQSEDRPHRTGLKNDLTIIDIIARKTIDESICEALISKKNLAETLVNTKKLFFGDAE
jgi:SNF2 family DNA or RNA helicase